MTIGFRPVVLLFLGLMLAVPTAHAEDDHPTAEQRTRIEAALRQLSFVSWGEIERENDGREWEVEDARTADGRKFDVRLSADDLSELSRRVDD